MARADDTSSYFNVALVIDGSGSLDPDLVGDQATDPDGLRYDAISLFLALLTNDGNNVGAIVFNDTAEFLLNTGVQPISGRDDKMALVQAIRDAGSGGDTDIGTALLAAVDALSAKSAENGLQSVVILFSDGRTDLGDDVDAYNTSVANKETAIAKAQQAGIPVYTICLQATDVADPAELQAIAERTSGEAVTVSSAADLSQAFESFYNLIFPTSSAERVDQSYGDDGTLSYQFSVPTYGAREVNIILDSTSTTGVTLTSPSYQLSADEVAANTISGGAYQVIKLVNPEVGTWNLLLTGDPGSTATVNVIYNVDTSAVISTADGATEFPEGQPAQIQVQLSREGAAISDATVTSEYTAKLVLENLADGTQQAVDMAAESDGTFSYTLNPDEAASYRVYAELTNGDLTLYTESMVLTFSNTSPALVKGDVLDKGVIVTPFTGLSTSIDLTEYFIDAQDGTDLMYSIVSSQLVADTVVLDGSVLDINTGASKSGAVVLQAADSQGAMAQMTLNLKVTDLRPVFLGIVIAVVVAIAVIGGLIWYRKTHIRFRGMIFVRNADPEYSQGNSQSTKPVRGKVQLSRFGVQGACGFDPKKSCFVATGPRSIEFRSSASIYMRTSGEPRKKVSLQNGDNVLYADKEHTKGLKVTVQPKDRGGFTPPRPRPGGSAASRPEPRGGASRKSTSRRP